MEYKGTKVRLDLSHYDKTNNNVIALLNDEMRKPEEEYDPNMDIVAVASIDAPENLADDEVAIRDQGANEGILQWLLDNGIVEAPHRYIKINNYEAPVCKIKKAQK